MIKEEEELEEKEDEKEKHLNAQQKIKYLISDHTVLIRVKRAELRFIDQAPVW